MATYGVTYGGKRNPSTYGVTGSRSLASLYGDTSMQPLSSTRPAFQPVTTPLDALGRVMQDNQNVFQSITPKPLAGNTAFGMLNPGTTTPGSTTPMPPTSSPTSPAPSTPTVSPAPSSTFQGTDLSADPILAQIKDIGRRSITDAAAGGLAGAKNDLINFGSLQVPQTLRDMFATETPSNDALLGDLPANPVLAALDDAQTAQAASANPFSTTAQLANAHTSNQHNIDQTSNLANLFYSSTHANQLADENNAYLGSQNSALQALAQALSGENTGVLDALNHAHDQYLSELPNAYARAIAAGGTGATGDTTTTPPPTDTTTPPPTDTSGGNTGLDPNSPLGQLLLSGAVRPAVRIGARPMQAF